MAVNNGTIMARAWLEGTSEYQQRIPDVTQAGIKATADALFDPMNRQYYNQFMNFLVNRIAYTQVEGKMWKNALGFMKKNRLPYGSSIQNVAFKWLKAHVYEDDYEAVGKMYRPDGVQWFYSQNRRDTYDITVNRAELQSAAYDEYGLNNFVSKLTELPYNSNEWDEYQIMKNQLAIYEAEYGFYRHKLSAAPTDEATGKEFLTAVIADSGRMKFPSTLYNASMFADIPSFVNSEDELILICTPDVNSAIKVNTYAGMFNLNEGKPLAEIVVVDSIPIPNAVAILTTRDIIEAHDTVYEMNSFYNPHTLGTNFTLNAWGIYAPNPFVPAVLYTTAETTVPQTVTESITGITITPTTTTASLGDVVKLTVKAEGTLSPEMENLAVRPNAATYAVSLTPSTTSEESTSAINSRTFVEHDGTLHIQKSGLVAGDVITVTANLAYINPTGETTHHKATAKITIK